MAIFSENVIRFCAYGRTNPHLYEGRPKISMLLQVCDSMMMYVTATTPPPPELQFFKRPKIIPLFIEWAMECKVLGGCSVF